MRHSAAIAFLLVLAVSLLAAPAQGVKEAAIEKLPTVDAQEIYIGHPPSEFCSVGDLNDLAWAIGNYVLPPEDYALTFDPMSTCAVCPVGFKVNTIHIFLRSSVAMDIVMSVDVGEVVYPAGAACALPGPVICNSGLYSVSLPQTGLWDVSLPIDCRCLWPGDMLYLSVHIESVSTYPNYVPDLVTDEYPSDCTSWNDYGYGWQDLFHVGFPGNLSIYADAECCKTAATEPTTWGQTKKLYR